MPSRQPRSMPVRPAIGNCSSTAAADASAMRSPFIDHHVDGSETTVVWGWTRLLLCTDEGPSRHEAHCRRHYFSTEAGVWAAAEQTSAAHDEQERRCGRPLRD